MDDKRLFSQRCLTLTDEITKSCSRRLNRSATHITCSAEWQQEAWRVWRVWRVWKVWEVWKVWGVWRVWSLMGFLFAGFERVLQSKHLPEYFSQCENAHK